MPPENEDGENYSNKEVHAVSLKKQKTGLVFQWPPGSAIRAKDVTLPQIPLDKSPFLVNLSGLAAEDVTADRIQRSYQIKLDWTSLLQTEFDFQGASGFEYVRRELEKSVEDEYDKQEALPPKKYDEKGLPKAEFLKIIAKKCSLNKPDLQDQFAFNYWKVLMHPGSQASELDFKDGAAYLILWQKKIDRIYLGIDSTSTIEINDLFIRDIAIRYEQIKSEVRSTSVIAEGADDLLDKAMKDNGLDDSSRTSLRRTLDKKATLHESLSRIRELQYRAASLGYRLDTDTGNMVKVSNISASYVPEYYRTKLSLVDELETGHLVPVLSSERPSKYQPRPDWTETNFSLNDALKHTVALKTNLFEKQGAEYVSPSGFRLSDVLSHIDPIAPDPIFSTISLPVYDIGVNTGERLAKVITAFRPLPGVMPIGLPRLFIEERYRLVLRWAGLAIGEVVGSTTLAPGEERTVVMERSTVIERETRNSATSSVDITAESSNEMVSELESESRRSRDASHSSNWSASASASGSFGFGSASGSAAGGQTWNETTNEFAKRLSKLTEKAASSLTAKTRYEVSSIASYKATTTTRDSTTINLKNINQGCALTLFLHQLTNRYVKELRISELTVTVVPAAESIFGCGLALPKQIQLGQVREILKAMTIDPLPLTYKDDKAVGLAKYYKMIIDNIACALREHYYLKMENKEEDATAALQEIIDTVDIEDCIELAEKTFRKLRTGSYDYLEGDGAVDGPCAGLMMSTVPSASNALEDYTVQLRNSELERRNAETSEILGRAHHLNALADSIRAAPPELVATVRQGNDMKTAVVGFVGMLRKGDWLLIVDNTVLKKFTVADDAVFEYQLAFASEQPWLTPDVTNIGFLVHQGTNLTLPFVV